MITDQSIVTYLFVKIETPSGDLLFSEARSTYTIDGDEYVPLGKFLSITQTRSELQSSSATLSIAVTGIPNSEISTILGTKIKGSKVTVLRKIFESDGTTPVSGASATVGRYKGYVNNYSLVEEFDVLSRTATNTIQFDCASLVDVLSRKTAGRKTNKTSEQSFYPTDTSMNRVVSLQNTEFVFGGANNR